MSDDASVITYLSDYIRASKDLIEIFKGLKNLLPKGERAEEAQERIDQAEKALRASEAQLAKAFGYNLCQCTFPPQIMLSQGRHPRLGDEIFKCDKCGKQEPSEMYFKAFEDDYIPQGRNPITGY